MWCRFWFQNAAFQTCLALQALTARPDEVFECSVHVHQNPGPYKSAPYKSAPYKSAPYKSAPYLDVLLTKVPLTWMCFLLDVARHCNVCV